MLRLISILILCILFMQPAMSACNAKGVWLQVLGSGGPEIDDQRASSSYLIWLNGKARILIDMGTGGMLRFEQSRANINDIDTILLTHLHVDHSNDLPALIKASYFSGRDRNLPVYGPTGNQTMPAVTEYLQQLFGQKGAYRYLSDYLDGRDIFRLTGNSVEASGRKPQILLDLPDYKITAIPVHHGPIPALAYRIDTESRSLVISGDMSNQNQTLAILAMDADLLVAHHAIPETASGVARNLHMPPSVIGDIAKKANVKRLILSHRMKRTLGKEQESEQRIRNHYTGPLAFADDLQCF